MRIGRARPGGDKFSGGLLRHGKDQQVLHGGKENLRGLVRLVVVAGKGEEIAHLLIEALFRGTDVPDAREHLVEVIRATIRVLQPLVVHHEALGQVFPQDGGCPTAELHPAR